MEYKPVSEYENYIIFEDGTVQNTKTGKQIATQPNSQGYLTVNLWKHNKLKKFLIHRLVAKAFVENPDNLPCVNHKDKNIKNNVVSNLEWCTYAYNSQYSLADTRREREKSGHEAPVKQLIDGEWHVYRSINEAHRITGISITTIRSSLNKMYKNPVSRWEYVNKSGTE